MFITLHVRPGARSTQVLRWQDGVLHVTVSAPPLEGRANDAMIALVAATLDVPKSRVSLVRGEKSRTKVVLVEGAGEAVLAERLVRFQVTGDK